MIDSLIADYGSFWGLMIPVIVLVTFTVVVLVVVTKRQP